MMKLVVVTNAELKEELLAQGLATDVQITWLEDVSHWSHEENIDGFIDLLFSEDAERISQLQRITACPVLINYVAGTLNKLPANFIRFNGWPTFLKRNIVEAACSTENDKQQAEAIIACFTKQPSWTPDVAGFISPRVIAMIVQEAYLALDENVSTKMEIDTAMKLGTNYPYGPFEWSEKIGLKKIYSLLELLSLEQSRYSPAALMQKESML